MNQPNPSTDSLLDVFIGELQSQVSQGPAGSSLVFRSASAEPQPPADLVWWSWSLSIDPACRILAGASGETWKTLCGLGEDASAQELTDACVARLTPAVEQTARSRFGSEVICSEGELSEAPPQEWSCEPLTVTPEAGPDVQVYFSVSADLEAALGGPGNESEVARPAGGTTSADILMQVEMPVSISLGRTKMRMKDLLNLTNGSVVELDQELGDEVEIRVNKCVIAYGEVVAVDGNYAVRILRMAAAQNTPSLQGVLPERAA